MPKFIYLVILFVCAATSIFAQEKATETIYYNISPVGISEYQDLGLVDFRGRKLNLVIFKTEVAGFKDTEKIYSDPSNGLPLWVERDISMWLKKEYITEQYIPQAKSLMITKYNKARNKKIEQHFFTADGPIHNAVLLPFIIRREPNLTIGWSYDIRLPDKMKVTLASIEEVAVPAGKFKAYHFTSVPHKFEIWITADKARIPVKIKGVGFPYTLVMEKRAIGKEVISP